MEGTCKNPMKGNARCVFAKAVEFTVFVVNDEKCRTCHTGNILMEIMRRFPGARFCFVSIESDSGRRMIRKYGLETYPAFLFDTTANRSEKFGAIRHTFTRTGDKFILQDDVVKSYHYFSRPVKPGEIALFGSFQNPPFIETLRDFRGTVQDAFQNVRVSIHPFALPSGKGAGKDPWTGAYESPYGPDEVRAGVNQLCVLSKYPLKQALDYMVCRGYDVQKRFETRTPENRNEWKTCAAEMKLDTAKIRECETTAEGRKLFEKSADLVKELRLDDPGPLFLLNNNFKITGYNPFIRKIILRELRKQYQLEWNPLR
jgi:predicted DCC family thiol-disulfide oxidoreductase YuxK